MAVIVSVSVVWRNSGPGELLTMSDGSVWFHPYGGGAPVREREAV